jgi:hypothetical protein
MAMTEGRRLRPRRLHPFAFILVLLAFLALLAVHSSGSARSAFIVLCSAFCIRPVSPSSFLLGVLGVLGGEIRPRLAFLLRICRLSFGVWRWLLRVLGYQI